MDDTSIGPEQEPADVEFPGKRPPSQDAVDAQKASEFDMERGLAGAEAKPFRPQGGDYSSLSNTASAGDREVEHSADSEGGLVSGRRNAGRDSPKNTPGSDAQP